MLGAMRNLNKVSDIISLIQDFPILLRSHNQRTTWLLVIK